MRGGSGEGPPVKTSQPRRRGHVREPRRMARCMRGARPSLPPRAAALWPQAHLQDVRVAQCAQDRDLVRVLHDAALVAGLAGRHNLQARRQAGRGRGRGALGAKRLAEGRSVARRAGCRGGTGERRREGTQPGRAAAATGRAPGCWLSLSGAACGAWTRPSGQAAPRTLTATTWPRHRPLNTRANPPSPICAVSWRSRRSPPSASCIAASRRRWLSFSVSPVTSAPVLLADWRAVKLRPLPTALTPARSNGRAVRRTAAVRRDTPCFGRANVGAGRWAASALPALHMQPVSQHLFQ
jgi:hypothetical protein